MGRPRPRPPSLRRTRWLALAATGLAACAAPHPRAIAWGHEACEHCHMTLEDHRFAAEFVSTTGKAYIFDDVGCLATWIGERHARPAGIWVASFTTPDTWLAADSAVYLKTAALSTPMGSGLAALRPGREADSVRAALGGELLRWEEVVGGRGRTAFSVQRTGRKRK